jgi:hypothetical protein
VKDESVDWIEKLGGIMESLSRRGAAGGERRMEGRFDRTTLFTRSSARASPSCTRRTSRPWSRA